MNWAKTLKLALKKGIVLPWRRWHQKKLTELADVPVFFSESFAEPRDKMALFVSLGAFNAKGEAVYLKAMEAAGYDAVVLSPFDYKVADIFAAFGIKKLIYWDELVCRIDESRAHQTASAYLSKHGTSTLLDWKNDGISVGKFAASSYMRLTRSSNLTTRTSEQQKQLTDCLAQSLIASQAATALLNRLKPDLVFVIDRGYTPVGQIFDECLNRGIPVVSINAAHKSGYDIVKRYSSADMAQIHPQSLSEKSWEMLSQQPFPSDFGETLIHELASTYGSGDWFSEVGTQFNKVMYDKKNLHQTLGLDPAKKTAVIFPHMFWDATFFWGEDLFADYYDWFVKILKAASQNSHLNWVVKIHPANVVKAKRDRYKGGYAELEAVYQTLETLPPHIRVIEPESDINTFSLFSITDYCLTVRGTVGLECAAMGIVTVTAGTGRYDRHGFTYDFSSPTDYLAFVANLHDVPPMSAEQVDLARRFAYGVFLCRPLLIDVLDYRFAQDESATLIRQMKCLSKSAFLNSTFVTEFNRFVLSGDEDYLRCPPCVAS